MSYDPIIAGEAIDRFLTSQPVRQVFDELKLTYFNLWVDSKEPSERERIHAQARALDDLLTSLQAVADAGALAKQQAEKQ